MKLQEYKQLVAGKLGIRQDTVKQQRGLIRWMIDNQSIHCPGSSVVGAVHGSMEALRRDISH